MRRRKVTYPPPKTATRGAVPPGSDPRSAAINRAVSIDLHAMAGQTDVRRGDSVRIASGLFEGELATVESTVGGVVPAVIVRTASGRTRRVRAIDLVREGPTPPAS